MSNSAETSGRAYPKDKRETFKISTYKQFCYNKNLPGKAVVKPFIKVVPKFSKEVIVIENKGFKLKIVIFY